MRSSTSYAKYSISSMKQSNNLIQAYSLNNTNTGGGIEKSEFFFPIPCSAEHKIYLRLVNAFLKLCVRFFFPFSKVTAIHACTTTLRKPENSCNGWEVLNILHLESNEKKYIMIYVATILKEIFKHDNTEPQSPSSKRSCDTG